MHLNIMQEELQKYLKIFDTLTLGVTKYGKAPHKIVMLLSVLQAVKNQLITQNRIYVMPELIAIFRSNWNDLVLTQHVCNFALPFWHLKGNKKAVKTKFWHPVAKPGYEMALQTKESVSSLGELNAAIDYVVLNEDLFSLMKDATQNAILTQFLLEKYFPDTKDKFSFSNKNYNTLLDDIEDKILNESREEYQVEIKKLLLKKDEEEIFLRGSLFKREIPKIYNNTCCISGMRIDTTINASMIDACHIVPFSHSYDDTVTNGIALCPNLHRAFDRGLIAIDDDYRVMVNNNFVESENAEYSIRIFNGRKILLPDIKKYHPSLENFQKHRSRFLF